MSGKTVLFAPHSDDETLFAAFSIIRYQPLVVICYPSTGDYGDTHARSTETLNAVSALGGVGVEQWFTEGEKVSAILDAMYDFDERLSPEQVLAPHDESSHPDHVRVAVAAKEVFGPRVVQYHTYNKAGKVRRGVPVTFEPTWVGLKLRALACYQSQIAHPRAYQFFTWDLAEYVEP